MDLPGVCKMIRKCKNKWTIKSFFVRFRPKMGPGCPRNFFYKFWTLSLCFLYQKTLSCKKSKKSNDPISRKLRKSRFLGKFGPKMGPGCPRKFFFKNRAPSHSRIHENLSSCKKLEKTNDPISRKTHNRRTDGRTGVNLQDLTFIRQVQKSS